MTITILFFWLSLAGTAVFAVSGALQALRNDMDIVGVSFIACVTGVGGGTMRDLLLGATPVAWVNDPTDIIVCVTFAGLTVVANKQIIGRRLDLLLWADAVGMALFAVLGAAKAQQYGAHPLTVILFGAMSATFGGIVRDVICNEIPVLFRKEIYITAALIGGVTLLLLPVGLDDAFKLSIAVVVSFTVRACSIVYGWSLPKYG
ncbi:trimeric intracellular cation channel family protein [Temperatibacter marinus]|uniref:Trimeric intracellular cation channel family protein n=1 Tax=Temperatibacter marinus TaxID=1456591 RepID=A0AA52ECR6_9PROT|nr:trimeric intracellular cation channel family protein [Temperatibacter marinus]WND03032.1 trimeric intracellular cation channel family protein [Temperatibacter marinus]